MPVYILYISLFLTTFSLVFFSLYFTFISLFVESEQRTPSWDKRRTLVYSQIRVLSLFIYISNYLSFILLLSFFLQSASHEHPAGQEENSCLYPDPCIISLYIYIYLIIWALSHFYLSFCRARATNTQLGQEENSAYIQLNVDTSTDTDVPPTIIGKKSINIIFHILGL